MIGKWDAHRLSRQDGLALAQLIGAASRYGYGNRKDVPRDEAIAALHAISTSPVLLGMAAAGELAARHAPEFHERAVELLRAAGADMTVAAERAEEIRRRLDRTPGP